MVEQAREILPKAPTHRYEPRLQGMHGAYRFDIDGEGSWLATIDDGAVDVAPCDPGARADLVVGCDAADLGRLLSGEQNLVTAFMQGRVRLEGDPKLALLWHDILPSPKRPAPAAPS